MNHFDTWLSSAAVQALGWTLIHFIWQGALLALLLPLLLRSMRTSNARYAAALATLVIMGAAPVITFLVLFRAPSATISGVFEDQSVSDAVLAPALGALGQFSSSNWPNVDWLQMAVLLWFAGIVVLSLRTLGGWYLMERLRRPNVQLTGSVRVLCLQLQERIGVRRAVSYCQSYLIEAPSVIGWFRPVVLLPASALTGLSPSQIEAIIVHELAHIWRLDAFVNLFQIALETVLFYHPGVWWVSRRIRMERENCCDDMAVSMCGNPLDYAKALTLMEGWRNAPALALGANGGSLKTRIARLLGMQTFATGVPRGGLAALALVLSAGVLLAGARFTGTLDQPHSYTENAAMIDPPAAPEAPEAPEPYPQPEPVPDVPAPAVAPAAPDSPMAQAPSAPQEPPAPPSPAPPPAGDHTSYIDGMAAAGYTNLSVDDLIAMKIQGITPEYARDMRATGVTFSRSQLVEMKIQGVTPDFARHIRETWKDVTAHELIAMRIQGVDPGDVAQFRQLGFGDVSLHEIIEMKIQGVTPDYARRIKETWKDATVHELIAMRIQGVEPGDVGQFRQLGLSDVSLHTLVEMKIQGVTPEYVRQMKDAGFNGSTHEFVSAKIMGVTPDFVRMVRGHGFTDLSAHKLIQLKMAGVF